MATVETILQASARVLVEKGFAQMTTNAVAERAGVSVGSLYQYFPNKESLIVALHERHARQMVVSLDVILSNPLRADLGVEVARLVRAAVAAHQDDPALHRLLEEERACFERSGERAAVGSSIHRRTQSLLARHDLQVCHSDHALAAWVVMRMTESMVHSAVLYPSAVLDIAQVERTIVRAIVAYLTQPGD